MATAVGEQERKLPLPPGPRRYPLVGNLLQLKGNDMFYVKLSEMRKEYGDVLYLELGAVKMLVVFGHENVKTVLQEQANSFKYRPIWLVEIQTLELSNGIVWSNGLQNEKLRKFAMSAFHPGLGAVTLAQRVQTEAEAIVQALRNEKGNSDTLKKIFYKAICNINCALIFGDRYEYGDPEFIEFISLMDLLLQRHGVNNPMNFFPILQKLPESKKTKATKSVLNKVFEFIHGKIEAAKKTFDKNQKRSLIHYFIDQESNENPVTEENLCHIVRDFFVAGTENVAIGLLWCVGYMTQFVDIQEKCRKCLQNAPENKDSIELNDVPKPPYLEATVNEVLRLANVAPLSVPHAVQEDVPFGDYSIPKDTMVLTHLVSVHNDPKYWQDPEVFNPDRFIGPEGNLLKKEAFYPYSTGPRYCLAAKLAQMELLLIFSSLLKNFRFTDGPPGLKPTQPGAFVEPETFSVTWSPVQ